MIGVFALTLGDMLGAGVIVVMFGSHAYFALRRTIRQRRCAHDSGVNETQACDAICRKCGKNLGFIGTWRATTRQREP